MATDPNDVGELKTAALPLSQPGIADEGRVDSV
jgi:hypothetical protein